MANDKTGLFNWMKIFKPKQLDPIQPTNNDVIKQTNLQKDPNSQDMKKWFKSWGIDSTTKKKRSDKSKEHLDKIVQKFFGLISTRKGLLTQLEALKGNDVVQTIINVLIDEGFYSNSQAEIFVVEYRGSSEKDLIQKAIDSFVNEFSINDVIADILEDLLLNGEYFLRLETKKGQGVVDIIDDISLENMYAIYKGSSRQYYLKKTGSGVDKIDKNQYAHFVLNHKKIRVDLDSNSKDSSGDYLPSHIRVGRSVILGCMSKIKQLQTLEMGNIALDLKQIVSPIIAMIGVPATQSPDEVSALIEYYENHLSDLFEGVDLDGESDISELLKRATKIKVLPNYSDGKGSIETLQMDTDKVADREREESIRRAIAVNVGIPSSFLSIMGETGNGKMDNLKVDARFSKKLNSLQYSVARGIKELINVHLTSMGFDPELNNIVVKMRSITNVDMLENLDMLMTISEAIGNFHDNISKLAESEIVKLQINTDKYNKFLKSFYDSLPYTEGLIEIKQLGKQGTNTDQFI